MATTPRPNPFYSDEEPGVHMIWDNQFDQAFEYFSRQSNVKPRHGLHRAEVMVLKSFLTEDPKDRAEALGDGTFWMTCVSLVIYNNDWN